MDVTNPEACREGSNIQDVVPSLTTAHLAIRRLASHHARTSSRQLPSDRSDFLPIFGFNVSVVTQPGVSKSGMYCDLLISEMARAPRPGGTGDSSWLMGVLGSHSTNPVQCAFCSRRKVPQRSPSPRSMYLPHLSYHQLH